MLTISGVYAEDIDGGSSVVTESPISADADTGLSSGSAFNDDSSNIYEPSDSSDSFEPINSHGYFESSDVPQINGKIGCAPLNSQGYYGLSNIEVIDVDVDSVESVDVPVVDVNYQYADAFNCDGFDDEIITDIDVDFENVDYGTLKMSVVDVYDEEGELNQAINVVDDKVILNNYNSFSKNILESIYIPVSTQENLDRRDRAGVNAVDTIISEVTNDMETSESYKLIRDVTQADNLLKFESVDAILAISVSGVPNGETSEPVFDGILRASEYISNVEEVYFGTLSPEDNEMLLESVGSENTLLFASIANWYSGVTFEMLQDLANHGQICEEILGCCTVTKALLQYYPLTSELYIYKLSSDNEDEHSHVINDTNSHGLDYAYGKHVDVIYKDMPNLMVLTSYGIVFIGEQITAGSWDGLNDVLGARASSETLLPDHKAIWTPLLLLTQQDLQKSIVNSHADDNGKINKFNATSKSDSGFINGSNSTNKSHWGGKGHHKHWGYNTGHYRHCCCVNAVVSDIGSSKLDNITKNSTSNDTNSSNITITSKNKPMDSPKANVEEAEPTYTLVYAILGIAFVSILFNSSYLKRDD
ncbi:MAG: hypothetical protein IJF83_02010 [Methanobrevibacter sp.]|nr:hypothetical protein [Methanobrevibacter sp.]